MQENEHAHNESTDIDIDIDYVYGRDDYNREVTAPSIEFAETADNDFVLSEMNSGKRASSKSIKAMMMEDDMAMEVGKAKLREMTDKYGINGSFNSDLIDKGTRKNEQEELNELIREDMAAKTTGISHEHSQTVHNRFVDEQLADDSRRGFMLLLIMTAVGISVAALTYFLKLNRDGTRPYLDYLPIATVMFSLFMLIKSKFCRVVSAIYFALYTLVIIGPGLIVFATSPENQMMEEYILSIILYVLTALCSLLICIQLSAGRNIKSYYYYSPPKKNKRY